MVFNRCWRRFASYGSNRALGLMIRSPYRSTRLLLEASCDLSGIEVPATLCRTRSVGWVSLGAHHAAVHPISGDETCKRSPQKQRVTHRITLRCSPRRGGVRPRIRQRFRSGREVYDIKAVFDGGRGTVTCLCEAAKLPVEPKPDGASQ